MIKETINISGMHCTSCSLTLDKAIKKIDGVLNVKVNFMAQNAIVEYDETKVTRKDIEKTIRSVGYDVVN